MSSRAGRGPLGVAVLNPVSVYVREHGLSGQHCDERGEAGLSADAHLILGSQVLAQWSML